MLKIDEVTKVMAALGVQAEKLRVAYELSRTRNRKHAEAYDAAREKLAGAIRDLAVLL